ncbi:ROK family transcriptional regulator [Streptomyces sp. SL13]|uniref:ROK family transcriptional regulator n=1 Tax=Streptantibioticus silvisoli TaxID=2705255 RepID=A0AA90K1M2_9ACTN|nr:ROK family transcriptional regulator [Streptantibioticus silvisoli]MDI5967555.1 ROK family transcriptional regulator [Streptantibioticus silvisoli]MDI5973961.1 ROK family transcriptional regulator [Streptantibioticus silvisoli]
MADRKQRTVRDLRRGNRSALLRHLWFEGPLSRQELGRDTGLSAGSISNVVGELLADGLVEEAGAVDSDGGRPRTLLKVAAGYGRLAGVDIGETRVRVGLFDLDLSELAVFEQPLSDSGHDVDHVVRLVLDGLAAVLSDTATDPARVLGVGVGVPGIVERGPAGDLAVVHGQTIGWDAVPVGALLRAGTGLPLHIENGAKTLGQAEMWFGGGRGARDAVIALIGSGVGACVVADGEPYRGSTSSAGEWGHTTLSVGGRRCRCGARGHLEAYVGAEAVLDRWGAAPAGLTEEEGLAALLERDAAGDPAAREVLDDTAEYLGAGIADLINLFNPERILLGGWAGLLLGPRLLPAVRRHAAAYALRQPGREAVIGLGRLGPEAVTVGAATLPLARFLEDGGRTAPPAADRDAEAGTDRQVPGVQTVRGGRALARSGGPAATEPHAEERRS